MIQENIDLLRSIVPESSSFHIELAPNLPNIVGDPSQIQQVIMNLVINAAEAAAHSNAPVKVQTQVVNLEHPPPQAGFVTPILDSMVGSYIRLDVQDRGIGIAPENLRKIFDPFFTTKENGKGLGLSATLGIVNAHNGALFVQSQPK